MPSLCSIAAIPIKKNRKAVWVLHLDVAYQVLVKLCKNLNFKSIVTAGQARLTGCRSEHDQSSCHIAYIVVVNGSTLQYNTTPIIQSVPRVLFTRSMTSNVMQNRDIQNMMDFLVPNLPLQPNLSLVSPLCARWHPS